MIDEVVEREKGKEEGGYHLGWDGDGLGQVQAYDKRLDDAAA
jgi:hypothetical protein